MLHLLDKLPDGSRALDLGAGSGSFQYSRTGVSVVRLDLAPPTARAPGLWVAADSAHLPFPSHCFDAIISNHSLEHFPELEATLREIGRVIQPGGSLYVAVPDAGTLADNIYRWLGRGGGHVNPFRSAQDVAALIQRLTGLCHRATHVLYTSLSFLNAHNFRARPPRKIALFAFGNERFLAVFNWLLRLADRRFGTRLSHYGWSFYFGAAEAGPPEDWINVCVRCGSGHSEVFLRKKGAIPPLPRKWNWYSCPVCGGLNLLTPEG
jgi:SAM-dependent methyltransferase